MTGSVEPEPDPLTPGTPCDIHGEEVTPAREGGGITEVRSRRDERESGAPWTSAGRLRRACAERGNGIMITARPPWQPPLRSHRSFRGAASSV